MIIVKTAADCNSARTCAEMCAFSAVRKGGGKECVQTIYIRCVVKKKPSCTELLVLFFIKICTDYVVAVNSTTSSKFCDSKRMVGK